MKHTLLLFGLWMAVAHASAQCTTTTLGLDPTTQKNKLYALDLADGEITAVMRPYLPNNLWSRAIIISRVDDNGDVIWAQRVVHTNPDFRLQPFGMIHMPDGGVFVHGDMYHGNIGFWGVPRYVNQFAVRLDAAGEVQWARIYQVMDSLDQGGDARTELRWASKPMANGHIMWALGNWTHFFRVELDEDGLPVDAHAYFAPPPVGGNCYPQRTIVREDGSMFGVSYLWEDSAGYTLYRNQVFKVAPDGQVAWASRFEGDLDMHGIAWYDGTSPPHPEGAGLNIAANGDLLMLGNSVSFQDSRLVRLSDDGQSAWRAGITDAWWGWTRGVTELPGGELLIGSDTKLLQLNADGTATSSAWEQAQAPLDTWSHPDKLVVGLGTPQSAPYAKLAISPSAAQLNSSCELNTTTNTGSNVVPMTITPGNVEADTAYVKTWFMALEDTTALSLDLLVGGSFGWLTPGQFTTVTGGVVNNSGTECGTITVTITLPTELNPVSYTPSPTNIAGNVITWTVAAGLPADGYWSCSINAQLEPDAGLIGTTLSATITASQAAPEVDLSNNTYTFQRNVTGPYDPNNKLAATSSHSNDSIYFTGTDEWIDYTINFKNTGNAPAVDVVLVDTLPTELRVASFLKLASSHPCTYELGGNGVLRFIFDGINLPDSTSNEAASHGSATFRIKPESGLLPGTLVANRADIFFDFNPAVRTADSRVWIDQVTALAEQTQAFLQVFPVPVHDRLMVSVPAGLQPVRLSVHAMDGRCLMRAPCANAGGTITLPVNELAPQAYVLTLEGADGRRLSARFVKQ